MNLQQRLDLLQRLGDYISSDNISWEQIIEKAYRENGWFIPEFIRLATNNIASEFLQPQKLKNWVEKYGITGVLNKPRNVGVVMAGNIPLVGFHDFLSVFVFGHRQTIKPSSKDQVLIRHLLGKLDEWDPAFQQYAAFADMLKGCDAYVATGSNNSSRYFKHYFGKYPNIIRSNRTSVAVLSGQETMENLSELADDVYQYFGLGCRNVTKLYVPRDYDFVPILNAFRKYNHLADHNKYRNNYDYQLAVLLINKELYMTNGSIILRRHPSEFSAISTLNYEFYEDSKALVDSLKANTNLQCIVGDGQVAFGTTQSPGLDDFADGVNTMLFLRTL